MSLRSKFCNVIQKDARTNASKLADHLYFHCPEVTQGINKKVFLNCTYVKKNATGKIHTSTFFQTVNFS